MSRDPSCEREYPRVTKRTIRHVAGYSCLTIGLAGLVLPVLPGIPFLIAAVGLFGPDHVFSRQITRLTTWWKARHGPINS